MKRQTYYAGIVSLGLCLPVSLYGAVDNPEMNDVRTTASVQQSVKLYGTVIDETGLPVIGASVMVKGTTNGTITDVDGKFELTVGNNDVLSVSYIGYETQEIRPSGNNLVITLKENSQMLNEVVVLGYGANARKQDLSASVGVVDNTESLATRPVSSTEGMLQGQLAGVTV